MCGIFGIIHSNNATHKLRQLLNNITKDAMEVGIVRGEDSTGMYQVRYNGEIKSYKVPYNGVYFTGDANAKELLNNVDVANVTVGHHRAATRGTVCAANAHPFQHETTDGNSIIGVHNGYVTGYYMSENGKKFNVDSDWLFHRIARDGGAKALGEIEGHIAAAWYDTKDKKLRLFTNGKRTLYWNYVPKEDIMIFASEHEMLYWLCSRNGLDIEKTMWTGHEDRIYAFDPNNVRKYSEEILEDPPKKEHKNYAPFNWDKYNERLAGKKDTPPAPGIAYNKTFQGEPISYDPKDVARLGYKLGDIVEFWCEPEPESSTKVCIQGDVMLEVDNAGKTSVEFVKALMVNVTPEIYDAVTAAGSNILTSETKARVIGASKLNTKDGPKPCIILNKPLGVISGNQEPKREHDIELVVPVWDTTFVTKARFKELVNGGCGLCGGVLTEDNAHKGKIKWYGQHPYCEFCSGKLEEQEPNLTLPELFDNHGPTAASLN